MKKHIVLLCWLFTFFLQSYSQQQTIDSMEVFISRKDIKDEEKVIPLVRLGICYLNTDDTKALKYALQSADIARKQDDYKHRIYAYSCLSAVYNSIDSLNKSYLYIDSCLLAIHNTSDIDSRASGLNSIALIKMASDDMDGVGDLLLEGVELIHELQKWEYENKLGYNLYEYYARMGDPNRANKYIKMSLNGAIKKNHPMLIIHSWNGLSSSYQELYKINTSNTHLLDSAKYAVSKALEVYKKDKDRISLFDYLEMLDNYSSIYLLENKNDSVLYYTNEMIRYANEIGDIEFQSKGYMLQSKIQLENNNLTMAENLLLQSLLILDDSEIYLEVKYDIHNQLSQVYEKKKQFDKALENKTKAFDFYQRMNLAKYLKEGQIAEAKYKVIQKEKEIAQYERQQQTYRLHIIIVASLLIFLIFIYISTRQKLKNTRQEALILETEKENIELQIEAEKIESQRLLAEKLNIELQYEIEKNESSQKAVEINKLQREVLAGNIQIEHKNKTIEVIGNELTENDILENQSLLKKIISRETRNSKNFEDFYNSIKEIHPDFYNKLQEKANYKLTGLDLKYCVYIYMNVSSKDISEMLFVEPKTVRMAKYRLKGKLGLDKNDDLSEFVQRITNSN